MFCAEDIVAVCNGRHTHITPKGDLFILYLFKPFRIGNQPASFPPSPQSSVGVCVRVGVIKIISNRQPACRAKLSEQH